MARVVHFEIQADDLLGINRGRLPRPTAAPAPRHSTNNYVCTMAVDDYVGLGPSRSAVR